ncbi:hypothetical protein ABG067_003957 [Albugo candida]
MRSAMYRRARKFHSIRRVGKEDSTACRYRFYDYKEAQVSPWHDIPLRYENSDTIFHFISEIPRGERAKMEIACNEPYNPIKQDVTRTGSARFYHSDSLVNYGCLPQTWENPLELDPHTGFKGDNDPVDVVELSQTCRASIGDVLRVKVLGVLGMIDDQETDWKIIGINMKDPIASQVEDIEDLYRFSEYRVLLPKITEWFRDYKIPDGKLPSEFAFDGKAQSQALALKVIEETHNNWKDLMANPQLGDALWTRH